MSKVYVTKRTLYNFSTLAFIFIFLLTSCTSFQTAPIKVDDFVTTEENYPKAEVVFQVKIPNPLNADEKINLEIIDEVTGILLNPTRYEMAQQSGTDFFIRLPLTIGLKVKYRFLRKGSQTFFEYNTQRQIVRYRVAYINGPLLLQDSVAGWADQPYDGPVGRIRGQLIDKSNNSPIPNMAIYAAGMQTLSSSDGTFILEGLPPWTHNVVIASLDGAFETFQQGAAISEEATTPIRVTLQKRPLIETTFLVKLPAGFNTNLPLRLASNFYSLGFMEDYLGSNPLTLSSNLPILLKSANNLYSLSVMLPAGADIRYKFTLGDGFWNTELSENGGFLIRDLIVPNTKNTIQKQIELINPQNMGEITFNVQTPSNTPPNDKLSIQLNSFGWMQPLEMVKISDNQWSYSIYSPTHLVGNIEYRFCRNDNCQELASISDQTGQLITTNLPQSINEVLDEWKLLNLPSSPTEIDTFNGAILPRTDFVTGFELATNLQGSWQNSIDQGLSSISSTGANWVIVTPTWSPTSINPPLFEPLPGQDLLWPDLQELLNSISKNNLQPAIFPIINGSDGLSLFWTKSIRDAGWWQSFFDRYQRFILQNADLAQQMNASAIIVGDPNVIPAMSDGKLADGSNSNAPENADDQWRQLIQDIRSRYQGPVIGVICLPSSGNNTYDWLNDVDAIYVQFSPSLTNSGDSSTQNLENVFGSELEKQVKPFAEKYSKTILIGINYPSTPIALEGCIDTNGSCQIYTKPSLQDTNIDLNLQSRIYNAAFVASAKKDWVNGFISREFDPTLILRDQGSSVYGKPALDVLWFWIHLILNKPS